MLQHSGAAMCAYATAVSVFVFWEEGTFLIEKKEDDEQKEN
jgi:hypothetical protein